VPGPVGKTAPRFPGGPSAEKAEGKGESIAGSMHRSTRETGKAVRYEYRDLRMNSAAATNESPYAAPVHQNYLAK
jgi:hypothetical protein